MWNKMKLRLRITLLCALCLTVVSITFTMLITLNAKTTFVFMDRDLTEGVNINFETAQKSFSNINILLMFGFIILGSILIWVIMGRALRPLTSLSKIISEIDETSLDVQLPVPESKDEISSLAGSFNTMIKRIATAYEDQKVFAQNAAHELKTPVASISAIIEVLNLDEEPDSLEYQEAIEQIASCTTRMQRLVQSLLLLNTQISTTNYTNFYFSDLLTSFKENYKKDIAEKKIKITLSGDTPLAGDFELLNIAFQNILHNAIRYNHKDGVIEINCTKEQITIRDQGVGIPKEVINKVFEPFYCVDPSRSRTLGGSGLGLSISKRIFEQHQMKISLQGEKGTTVTIKLI